jgi:simple sugar transport system permease protein
MKLRAATAQAGGTLALLAGAFVLCALFVVASGKDPVAALTVLLGYTLGTANGFLEVVVRAIPLMLAGLGVVVAFRANIYNVGADGQVILGAIVAVALTRGFDGAGWIALPFFLGAAILGGAAYGGFVGWLKARYNASEIIVTIMLNYIAVQLLAWVTRGPLQEQMHIFPRSDPIPDGALLGIMIPGSRVHWGLVIAIVATLVVYAVMRFSSFGFQVKAVGENRAAARYGGIDDRLMIVLVMALSGGLAGLAGGVEISGVFGRLEDNFAPGVGVTAIAVALLARLNPLMVPVTALLFGVLAVGTGAIQRQLGIPFPLVWIIEGVVILTFLLIGHLRARRLAAAPETAT